MAGKLNWALLSATLETSAEFAAIRQACAKFAQAQGIETSAAEFTVRYTLQRVDREEGKARAAARIAEEQSHAAAALAQAQKSGQVYSPAADVVTPTPAASPAFDPAMVAAIAAAVMAQLTPAVPAKSPKAKSPAAK